MQKMALKTNAHAVDVLHKLQDFYKLCNLNNFDIFLPCEMSPVVSPVDTLHTLINVDLCFLPLQGRMLSDWQRLVQERLVPLLCRSYSLCWPHHRGFTPLCSLLPGSWPFRYLSSLRPLAPALGLSVVGDLIVVLWATDFSEFHSDEHLLFAAVIVGGIDMMSQSLVLAKKPHIVIGKTTLMKMRL